MGLPIATSLARAGRAVVGYDQSADARSRASGPLHVADELEQALAGATCVVVSLPGAIARHVVLNEICPGLPEGALVIDTSTLAPPEAIAIRDGCARRVIDYVAAPVSGGVAGAVSGNLVVLAGGDVGARERSAGVLASLSSNVFWFESVEASSAIKLVHQTIFLGGLVLAGEGLATLSRLGAMGEPTVNALAACVAANNPVRAYGAAMLEGAHDKGGFPVEAARSELCAAWKIADENGVPTPVLAAVLDTFSCLVDRALGDADLSAVIEAPLSAATLPDRSRDESDEPAEHHGSPPGPQPA